MTADSHRHSERELYPFLFGDSDPVKTLSVARRSVRASTAAKCADIVRVRRQLIQEYQAQFAAAAQAMACGFAQGGKLIAFGNGGSATDAQDAVTDCLSPPLAAWRPLPAMSLVADSGVLTAIANDVGFENIFVRQLVAFGKPQDIAMGFSTSGNSPNVLAGLEYAKRTGMVTIALAGDGGGAMAQSTVIDWTFVSRVDHIPRIQEGHATVWHTLFELTHMILSEEPAGEDAA